MTEKEQRRMESLTTARTVLGKNLAFARGLQGNGTEAAYAAAYAEEVAYAHSIGLVGVMRPKRKYRRQ